MLGRDACGEDHVEPSGKLLGARWRDEGNTPMGERLISRKTPFSGNLGKVLSGGQNHRNPGFMAIIRQKR